MGVRIEVAPKEILKAATGKAPGRALPIAVYNINDTLTPTELQCVLDSLVDPIVEIASVNKPVIELGENQTFVDVSPKPGVHDPEGKVVQSVIQKIIQRPIGGVSFGLQYIVDHNSPEPIGNSPIRVTRIGKELGFYFPAVDLPPVEAYQYIGFEVPDGDLMNLNRERRLALNLQELHSIQNIFRDANYITKRKTLGLEAQPTDAELEAIAQTWSEHCKHKKFNAVWTYKSSDPHDEAALPERVDSVFKTIIQESFRRTKRNWLVSVFEDNAGVIQLNPHWNIAHKVETHNHPSGIDGFGGANTGTGGVLRDPASTGTFMRPVSSQYSFRVPPSRSYQDLPPNLQTPVQTLDGIVRGVEDYGNKMGIPTMSGTVLFDEGWLKPAVYVGCVAVAPAEIDGCPTHIKNIQPGYLALSLGGRVGKDGIHGATGSSLELRSDSKLDINQEVQIGDPIVEKCVFDAMEALQQLGLIEASQDCGAGGWNSAVGELAGLLNELEAKRYDIQQAFKENGITPDTTAADRMTAMSNAIPYKPASMLYDELKHEVETGIIFERESNGKGGVRMDLTHVPEKYKGLTGWEKLISEAQEREVVVIKPENRARVLDICMHFNVEATPLAEFNDSGDYLVLDQNTPIVYLPVAFLNQGLPQMTIRAEWTPPTLSEPEISPTNLTETLLRVIGQPNMQSFEWISTRYDHEVQAGSRIKPIVGLGRGKSDAIAYVPVLGEPQVVIETTSSNPWQGDIDAYHMGKNAVVDAVGRIIAAGGNLDKIAFNGNTTCPKPEKDSHTAAQVIRMLKGAADAQCVFDTPTISGKDSTSMERSYIGTATGKEATVRAKPELLMSAMGIAEVDKTLTTPDFKLAGDLIYVVGETRDELGASEFYLMHGETGKNVPKSDCAQLKARYETVSRAIAADIVHSAQYLAKGGLAMALSNCAIAGDLGATVDLTQPDELNTIQTHKLLFSETTGRLLVTIHPSQKEQFETAMQGSYFKKIGVVINSREVIVNYEKMPIVATTVDELRQKNKGDIKI